MDRDTKEGPTSDPSAREETVDNASDDHDDTHTDRGTSEITTHNPVDRGWAWVIVLSVFGIQFVLVGLLRSFGVIFVATQLSFQSSASMVAVLGGVESAFFSITALVCMSAVLEVMSVRRTILLGTLLAVVGFVGCFLATDIVHLILFFAVFIGVAMGMTVGPGYVLINAYFKHKLPFATSVANTGGSIGGVIMPIATRMLLDYYFLSGAFLLLGGLFAQNFIFGALLTPVEEYGPAKASHPENGLRQADERRNQMIQQQRLIAKQTRRDRRYLRTVSESAVLEAKRSQVLDSSTGMKHLTKSLLAMNDSKEHRVSSPQTKQHGSRNGFFTVAGMGHSHTVSLSALSLSTNILVTDSVLPQELLYAKVEEVECITDQSHCLQDSKSRSCCQTVPKKLSSIFDPALFRSGIFWLLAVYHYLGGLVTGLPAAYIPALAQEKGLTTTQGALLLTISGCLDILSRLVPGILAQTGLVKPKTSVAVSLVVLGVLFQFTALAEDMEALTLISVVYGLFAGVFFSMLPLILLEFSDSSRFRYFFGFTQLALGIGGTTGFPIVGYLKDTSGSYVTSFHFMGTCGLVATVLLILMSVLQRREAERRSLIPDPERLP